jgi:signal transduction histidine kinase
VGNIEIQVSEKNNHVIVSVSDNGIGIPAELLSKIFTPNFTTKTGGMGLGLAIVKSIAEGMGGQTWFETTEGKGTTFFVEMPLVS